MAFHLANGKARRRREERARIVRLTATDVLAEREHSDRDGEHGDAVAPRGHALVCSVARSARMKPCALAHNVAWQPIRGARHNGSFCEPEGREAVATPNEAQRSEWGDFAECGVMLHRGLLRFTPDRLCLFVDLF